MPKHEKQKEKLLFLQHIFESETDEAHPLTVTQLLDRLSQHGILAERKSIYTDIDALIAAGLDIELQRGRSGGYYLANRTFELAEVKLLVDAVQSSRFITQRKSTALIRKLQTLCSRHEAGTLARQVYVSGRVKNMNESIYYNIDALHTALAEDRRISFHYFHWALDFSEKHPLQKCRHRDGAVYSVSPFALLMDDGNYYLVGYDHDKEDLRHFRVDKMETIRIHSQPRGPKELLDSFHVPTYMKEVFGMFAGKTVPIKLQVKNHLVGAVLDRFGEENIFLPGENDTFLIHIRAVPSPKFLSFVAGFGADMKILEPASLISDMQTLLSDLQALYKEENK